MSKSYTYCNNCGKPGHLFHQCKHPITSLGIIAFRENNGCLEYLMIRRKDTLGYVDFLRGKYSLNNVLYLKNIIDVECLLENIKATYSTTEERLNHKGKDSHELPLNEPSELIFF